MNSIPGIDVNHIQHDSSAVDNGNIFTTGFTYCPPYRSGREEVQEEILRKMAKAVEAEDLEKARELVDLAQKLKEL